MSRLHTVIGAGPAGLVAAITLARAGQRVRVLERAHEVGHRFSDDFQGLENWSGRALDRLAALGLEPTFEYRPFSEIVFHDHRLRPTVARSDRPFFYLVRRGPYPGSLDRALLAQAEASGAEVVFSHAVDRAEPGDVVATGPRYADGIATGYVFPTDLPDQARCIVSEELAPAGYAYLLVWDGRATLATCLFDRHQSWREARRRTVDAFRRVVPDLDLDVEKARPFSGFGSVFGRPRFVDEAGRLYVGEAAGLQDPEWGFGMWYAMESGALAARCLLEGLDYSRVASARFVGRQRACFANRFLYERLPQWLVAPLLHRAASSPRLRERLGRHWKPSPIKSVVGLMAVEWFARRRLAHRDRGCHSPDCLCLWCTCGTPTGGEDEKTRHDIDRKSAHAPCTPDVERSENRTPTTR